ncbi:MAG TPA: enoyl-CoA hydratase/isomerase family protein [Rhizomicrobium sp.]|nr:enoyl-CoA hydratase/isomerase family protein [Rhizomicrobium sp.]
MLQAQVAPKFDSYRGKYKHIAMRREDGILEMRLHTDDGPLIWGSLVHEELGYCFADVATDRENKVAIIVGTGDVFCTEFDGKSFGEVGTGTFDLIYSDAKRLLTSLLSIEIPIIGAVNGPAHMHAEIPVLSDIVIASERSSFQDSGHFLAGRVPGDGVQIVWPALLGPNRGRYFLLTGQILDAKQAQDLGIVGEVVPHDRLLTRAWEVAREIAARPPLARRYARILLTHELKRLFHENLGFGLAHAVFSALDRF